MTSSPQAADASAPNVLDMSRWSGPLLEDTARQMIAGGVVLLIVGDGNPVVGGAGMYAAQQAKVWLDAGGKLLDAYVYLDFGSNALQQIRTATATLGDFPVRRWWLDAEDTANPQLTARARADFLDQCIAELQAQGKLVGIYTGKWWWPTNMGQYSEDFANLPLWNSYYDGDPNMSGLPYGGWMTSEIEQYAGTTSMYGQNFDLSFEPDLRDQSVPILDEPPHPIVIGEDPMPLTADELNGALQKRMLLRTAGWDLFQQGVKTMSLAEDPDLGRVETELRRLNIPFPAA